MPRKSSERSHRMKVDNDLNLTALMDVVCNLMFFLLMAANTIAVAIIDAPLPKVAATAEEMRVAKDQENQLDVIVRIRTSGFNISTNQGGSLNLEKTDDYQYIKLHEYLVGIHQKNTKNHNLTIIPEDEVSYAVIIKTIDAAREYNSGDAGYQKLPPDIADRPDAQNFNRLFSDVSFGGV